MLRKEKQRSGQEFIESVLQRATHCRLAMVDGNKPYVVPVFFGYADRRFYIHCAKRGHKLGILRRNPNVCVECDIDVSVQPAEQPCRFSSSYQSVIAFGRAKFLSDVEEKNKGLQIIVSHYSDDPGITSYDYSDAELDTVEVIEIAVDQIDGKQSGG